MRLLASLEDLRVGGPDNRVHQRHHLLWLCEFLRCRRVDDVLPVLFVLIHVVEDYDTVRTLDDLEVATEDISGLERPEETSDRDFYRRYGFFRLRGDGGGFEPKCPAGLDENGALFVHGGLDGPKGFSREFRCILCCV